MVDEWMIEMYLESTLQLVSFSMKQVGLTELEVNAIKRDFKSVHRLGALYQIMWCYIRPNGLGKNEVEHGVAVPKQFTLVFKPHLSGRWLVKSFKKVKKA